MLCAWTTNTIVLPEGTLVTTNEADRPTISALKRIGINMDTLPWETLYILQDGITVELQTRESRALHVLNEQKINMEQLSLQHNEVVSHNWKMVEVLEEACQMVPKLAIPVDAPAEARIDRLVVGVCEAWEDMTKVQLELNLQMAESRLKAHPSTPPKVREQRASAIVSGLEEIGSVVRDYTKMLEESFEVLTNLQEDPII